MAQRSALRHAAARSSAPAPRARVDHAHQRCVPERHPSDQRTRKEHCSPHHSTCAHRSLSRALLRHILEKKPRDTNKRGTINAQITARERLRRTRLCLARAPPDVLRGTGGQTVHLTPTLLRSRPIGSCSVRRTPTLWPGMDLPLVIPRGNGPPACPHNASRRASHLCKRRDPRLRAASAPRPCSPLLAHIPALLALACAHAVESSTHVLCQASGTMRATSLALCDMPYDPSVATRPSVPASHLRAPW